MTYIRRALLALVLSLGLAPAFAQVPAPVPALPDTERRTSYAITASTCSCAVNMALYGDSSDFQNWVEVFINGVRVNYNDATRGWAITSPSGSLANLARPITNAVLTFNQAQTGTVQIVGARRPRRAAQFNENAGVSARNLNQVFTDIISQNREIWDKTNDVTGRAILGLPGEAITALPSAALRSSKFFVFDASGNPDVTSAATGLGNVIGPGSSVVNNVVCWNSTDGTIIKDCGGGLPVLPNSYTIGDMLYASGPTTLSKLAAVAAGQPLISGGVTTAPLYAGSWAKFDVASKSLVIQRNATAFATPGATTGIFVRGDDTGEGRIDIGCANSDCVLFGGRINGTWASTTPVLNNQQILAMVGGGIDTNGATTFGQGGSFSSYACANWTASNHCSDWRAHTIAAASTTPIATTKLHSGGAWFSGNTVDPNTVAAGTPVIQGQGANAANALSVLDAYGTGVASYNLFRAARGTAASFTATQSLDALGGFAMVGATGAGTFANPFPLGTSGGVFVLAQATETWTGSAQGARLDIYTTPNTTAVAALNTRYHASGCLSTGTTGDCGAGVHNVLTGYRIGNAAASGNVLRGDGANFVSAQLAAADLSGLAAGVSTFLGTPSSANLRTALTDETGTGAAVFATSPALVTPTGIVATDIVNNGLISYRLTGVNFNSANTDNAFTLTPPIGYTRYQIFRAYISGCTATATTATFGVFTSAAGAGTAIVASGSAVTVSTASEDTANNTQGATVAVGGSGSTTSLTDQSLFWRIQTPQGSAVTCNVTLQVQWIS